MSNGNGLSPKAPIKKALAGTGIELLGMKPAGDGAQLITLRYGNRFNIRANPDEITRDTVKKAARAAKVHVPAFA